MKPCIRCGKFKKVDEFYKHPRMRDGHLNKCKECCKEYARHTRHEKSGDAEWVKKERARGRNKYHRLYAPEHPLRFVSPSAPQWVKDAAHNSVNNAVRDGRLPKPTNCEECGRSVPSRLLHGHHDDYYKPLDVRWMCATCHHAEHREEAA